MPHKELSVDEAMIKFKGRSSCKQYMPKKSITFQEVITSNYGLYTCGTFRKDRVGIPDAITKAQLYTGNTVYLIVRKKNLNSRFS